MSARHFANQYEVGALEFRVELLLPLLPQEVDKEDQTMKESQTYPLRLPRSLKEAVKRISREERTSINQFVAMAVAEKIVALPTARFFSDRKAGADFKAFDKIMRRRGGKRPVMTTKCHDQPRAV
jgi:hypothetical protein